MSAPDRYGPGRFRGTHHHDAHDGGGVTRAAMPWSREAAKPWSGDVGAGPTVADPFPPGSHWLDRDDDDDLIYADADAAAATAADPAPAEHVALDARAERAAPRAAATDERAAPRAAPPASRHDGWTPDRQRAFLAAIAEGFTVEEACRIAGLSPTSAYAFRRRAGGAAFALGWRAANLLAREHVADTLLARALHGQTETVTRANGDVIERHRYDNRLAASLLTRLDRQAEAPASGAPGAATHYAARMVAGEFDAYLDLVGRDGGPARAGLFVALRAGDHGNWGAEGEEASGREEHRAEACALADIAALARADRFVRAGAGTAAEVDVADLDPAARAGWTAAQWARAEAAGLLVLAPAPAPEPAPPADGAREAELPQLRPAGPHPGAAHPADPAFDDRALDVAAFARDVVWWDEDREEHRTCFAPSAGFDGDEDGAFGDPDYARSLTPDEAAVAVSLLDRERDAGLAAACAERDAWFATARSLLEEDDGEGDDGEGEDDATLRPRDGADPDRAPAAAGEQPTVFARDDGDPDRALARTAAATADTATAATAATDAAATAALGTVAASETFTTPTRHPAADGEFQ